MDKTQQQAVKKVYESPTLVELGSLHGLTLQVKQGPNCDVACFHIGSVSRPD